MLRGSSAFGAFIPDQYLANYVKKMGIAKYWLKKNIARWNRIGMALVFWIFSRSLRCAMMHAHILHKFLLNESSNFFLDCFLLETHFRGIPYMKNHGMAYAFEKASQWKGSRLRWCSVIYGSMLGKGLMDKQTCFFFFPPHSLLPAFYTSTETHVLRTGHIFPSERHASWPYDCMGSLSATLRWINPKNCFVCSRVDPLCILVVWNDHNHFANHYRHFQAVWLDQSCL